MTSHHAATGQGYGICGKLSRLRRATFQQLPQPRRRRLDEIRKLVMQRSGARGTRLGKFYLLDRCLLMGGTDADHCRRCRGGAAERQLRDSNSGRKQEGRVSHPPYRIVVLPRESEREYHRDRHNGRPVGRIRAQIELELPPGESDPGRGVEDRLGLGYPTVRGGWHRAASGIVPDAGP